MKKVLGIILLSLITVIGTGCMRVYETLTVNDDGTITETAKQCISKSMSDEMGGSTDPSAVIETLEDGQEYYCETKTVTASESEILGNDKVTLNKDIFYYSIAPTTDETVNSGRDISAAIAQSIYIKLTINLASDIVETNANVISETSGKTATFDSSFTGASWYAYTAHGKEIIDADVTAPEVTGVKDGGYYKTLPVINCTDETGAVTALVNGKALSSANYVNGKNVITATDIKGNTTTVTFYLDVEKPIIKGIKEGKIYSNTATFYVKDNVKLSKVTVDKKKQKLTKSKLVKKGKHKNYYKIVIKKKGKHKIVATDISGNKVTYKITIR